MDPAEPYPAYLEIDYPDRELNWVTSFFRPFVVIPIAIILGLVSGPAIQKEGAERPLAAHADYGARAGVGLETPIGPVRVQYGMAASGRRLWFIRVGNWF